MLNKIIIMGRLTHDPEFKTTQSGVSVVSFSIACERDFKNKETNEKETDFINVQAWRNTAEFISKYFSKGRMIVVEGRLQTRKYQDKDGNNRMATEIVADHVYFGDSKSDGASSNNEYHPVGAPVNVSADGNWGEIDAEDSELPF